MATLACSSAVWSGSPHSSAAQSTPSTVQHQAEIINGTHVEREYPGIQLMDLVAGSLGSMDEPWGSRCQQLALGLLLPEPVAAGLLFPGAADAI